MIVTPVGGVEFRQDGERPGGLRRRDFSPERIAQVKQMHRLLYRQGLTLTDGVNAIAALRGQLEGSDDDIALMLDFLAHADRGIVR